MLSRIWKLFRLLGQLKAVRKLRALGARLYHRCFPQPMPQYHMLILVCAVTGVIIGGATYLLNWLLNFIYSSCTSHMDPTRANPSMILLPVVGVLLTIFFVDKIIKVPLNHGCDRVADYLKSKNYRLPARLMFAPVIASSVTLGFGGSAGAEGPSAFAGASIGSNMARLFRLDQEHMRLLMIIGAGAGIAGIFRAPIGGVLFSLEVLRMPISTLPVIGLIVACLCAGMSAYLLAGSQFDVAFNDAVIPTSGDLPWVLLFGVICGLYSCYYSFIMRGVGGWLERIPNKWLRGIVSGLMIGVVIFVFPSLYATGYGPLGQMLSHDFETMLRYSFFAGSSGDWTILAAIGAGVVMLKPWVCSATNYGGGVAGNFAPTLFVGGFLGFVSATMLNHLCGFHMAVSTYVYIGMAGAMSGIIEAPIMSIFLIAEMANHSEFLWPVAVVSMVSWSTHKFVTPLVNIFPHVTLSNLQKAKDGNPG